ncbi:hypothetical protein [Streptomyces naphthomycinicus]|uniref:hypothetical protein n=1 Tax=Streptomyces naphthomycinicus TaxID=2872625 RepID=UPI001CEC2BC4|nr:hypothetical protein [Streptomyces sp. TML10]
MTAAVALSAGLAGAAPALAAAPGAMSATSATGQDGAVAAVSKGATWHCSKGGFTGYIYINYTRQSGRADKVNWVQYKIVKGRSHGGNKADVTWGDGGVVPRLAYKTHRGKQDGQWHWLGGSYSRGGGDYGFSFTFDKSHASDPHCGKALGNRLP